MREVVEPGMGKLAGGVGKGGPIAEPVEEGPGSGLETGLSGFGIEAKAFYSLMVR